MSAASQLTARLLSCNNREQRETLYQTAERDYGKSFSDHLRDVVESHHLITENERGAPRR